MLHLLTHMLLKCFFEGAGRQAGRRRVERILEYVHSLCLSPSVHAWVLSCVRAYSGGPSGCRAVIWSTRCRRGTCTPHPLQPRPTPSPTPPTLLSPPPPHFSAATSRHSPPSHPVARLTPAAVGGTNQPPKSILFSRERKLFSVSAADRVALALCNKLMNVL